MCAVRLSPFISLHSSFPSIPGIITSLMTKSGCNSCILDKASCPFEATSTRYCNSRLCRINKRKSSLSSTTSKSGKSFRSVDAIAVSCPSSIGTHTGLGNSAFTSTCLTGKHTTNTAPVPMLSKTSTVPSCSLTKSRTRLKPMPLPVISSCPLCSVW